MVLKNEFNYSVLESSQGKLQKYVMKNGGLHSFFKCICIYYSNKQKSLKYFVFIIWIIFIHLFKIHISYFIF